MVSHPSVRNHGRGRQSRGNGRQHAEASDNQVHVAVQHHPRHALHGPMIDGEGSDLLEKFHGKRHESPLTNVMAIMIACISPWLLPPLRRLG